MAGHAKIFLGDIILDLSKSCHTYLPRKKNLYQRLIR